MTPPAGPGDGSGTDGSTVPQAGTVLVDADLQNGLRSALLREMATSRATLAVAGALLAGIAVVVELVEGSLVGTVATVLAMLLTIVFVARRTTRARVTYGYPLGTVLGAGFDRRVVRIDTGEISEELDHTLFESVDAGPRVVRLRFRLGGVALVPAALVPGEELRRIQDGLAVPPPGEGLLVAKARLPWAHVVTAQDREARRSRMLRAIHRARRTAYGLVVVVAVLVYLPTSSPLPFLALLLIPLLEVQDRLRVARGEALVFAEDAPLRAGIEGGHLVVCTPTALSRRPLSRLTEVIALKDLVVLRWDLPLFETQYPPGLFPPAAIDRLKAALPPEGRSRQR
jgi:hypothetical protein